MGLPWLPPADRVMVQRIIQVAVILEELHFTISLFNTALGFLFFFITCTHGRFQIRYFKQQHANVHDCPMFISYR